MSSFCICKSYSHFFSKNTCEFGIVLSRTANIFTTTGLAKPTMLCTTRPRTLDKILKGLDPPGSFSTTFYKGDNFYSVCFSAHQAPSEKESTVAGTNMLPLAAYPFFSEYTIPFRKGDKNNLIELSPLTDIHSSLVFCLNQKIRTTRHASRQTRHWTGQTNMNLFVCKNM